LKLHFFQFLPYDPSSEELRPFNVRIEELSVIDAQFLHGWPTPVLVIIYQVMHHHYSVVLISPAYTGCAVAWIVWMSVCGY